MDYKQTSTPTLTPGYRLIQAGETIQPGDQVFDRPYWRAVPASMYGQTVQAEGYFMPLGWYQRPSPPTPPTHSGYGYRWLKPGEKLQAGDEVWAGHAGVLNATAGDYIPVLGIGNTIGDPPPLQYRRALVVPAGWELAGEVPPDKEPEKGWKYWQPSADRWSESAGPTGCNRNSIQYTYIRPIEPTCEEGYRWLKEGEALQLGDQFAFEGQHGWRDSTYQPGYRISAHCAGKHLYRRPLTPPEEKACRKALVDLAAREDYYNLTDFREGWLAGLAHAGFTGPTGGGGSDWQEHG